MNRSLGCDRREKTVRLEQAHEDVVRENDVPVALDELSKSTEELNAVMRSLWDRLEPVARLEPEATAIPDQPAHGQCQLSRAIRQQSEKIQGASRSVYRLLELLEV